VLTTTSEIEWTTKISLETPIEKASKEEEGYMYIQCVDCINYDVYPDAVKYCPHTCTIKKKIRKVDQIQE